MTEPLAALRITPGDVVSLVGGGGKSTLVLGLARESARRGDRVVITTTTKMGVDQIPTWAELCLSVEAVEQTLAAGDVAFLIGSVSGEKVNGVDPATVDTVTQRTGATVFVEADGARRRPFKAPGENEPVIPSTSRLVIVVVGIDAVGQQIQTGAHRPHRVSAITGRGTDERIRPKDVARVANHPDGGRKNVPPGCRVALAVTKLDDTTLPAFGEISADLDPDIEVVGVDRSGGVVGHESR